MANKPSSWLYSRFPYFQKSSLHSRCFSPPTALFPDESSEPNEPTCNEVELNIQSDVNTTESVTLSQCVQVPVIQIHNGRMVSVTLGQEI